MSVQTQIDRISGNITAALSAIAEKGVSVPDGSTSDTLAGLIASIEAGGGGNIAYGFYTPAENELSTTIVHGLGTVPSFAIYVAMNMSTTLNYTIYACGGVTNASYFRFGRTTSNQITIKEKSNALTSEISPTNACLLGSLNQASMVIGCSDSATAKYYLAGGVTYFWVVLGEVVT